MLPISYDDASVRNVTPVCPSRLRIGIGFDIEGRETVRVALTVQCAQFILQGLQDYIRSEAGNQSATSSLICSAPRSDPSDGV